MIKKVTWRTHRIRAFFSSINGLSEIDWDCEGQIEVSRLFIKRQVYLRCLLHYKVEHSTQSRAWSAFWIAQDVEDIPIGCCHGCCGSLWRSHKDARNPWWYVVQHKLLTRSDLSHLDVLPFGFARTNIFQFKNGKDFDTTMRTGLSSWFQWYYNPICYSQVGLPLLWIGTNLD